ncbi:Methyltransferase domain-containing protein [Desulfuromusa kysingii]|uniref:Methyltransferase domain-containing protein n=1 Tax=Desulfuromusa kysingii TaxID=37625 RepID=A0A1H4BLY5_9BACT|nr:class I SAM-dependent methyltransferase [Desulfuromusa kysingii]SEA49058.1 Methyltransferase domain-containing protein [Desulfuromusa kysingii]
MDNKKFNPKKLLKLNDPLRLLDIPPEYVCGQLTQQQPEVLVEIGAGTAFFSVAFHQQLHASTTYACDVSATMIAWMKENISPNHPHIIPVQSDESAVPLADEIAHLVLMINLHHELEDQGLVIKEAYRLLKPGGEIFIIDWKKEEMPHGPPVTIRCHPQDIEQQLTTAGFLDIKIFDEMKKHFLIIGQKH